MIDLHPDGGSDSRARLVLRPNRAMNARRLGSWFFALAALALGSSLASWTQGNAFAPLFALLLVACAAICLVLTWRSCERSEVIVLCSDRVDVWRGPAGVTTFTAHPAWVRVQVTGDGRL